MVFQNIKRLELDTKKKTMVKKKNQHMCSSESTDKQPWVHVRKAERVLHAMWSLVYTLHPVNTKGEAVSQTLFKIVSFIQFATLNKAQTKAQR